MGSTYRNQDYATINLDKHHLHALDITSKDDHLSYHKHLREQHNAIWLMGGYLECRALYKSMLFNSDHDNIRDIHLGIDIWGAVESEIHAPLDATIHSFAYNDRHLDYGYTLILKHVIGLSSFYTLYGHLGRKYYKSWTVGDQINAGDVIGVLGSEEENGGWMPHLHFQVIYDLQSMEGDYPGVCSQKDLPYYRINCPDPLPLINMGT